MLNKKLYRNRLLKLADFLETVPRKNFNMEIWATTDRSVQGVHSLTKLTPVCSTDACALGWATVVFPRSLALEWDNTAFASDYGDTFRGCSCEDCVPNSNPKSSATVVLKSDRIIEDLNAAQEFFGLASWEAEELFMPDGINRTPKAKAKQIRRFVTSQARKTS